jgi:hypothetical protein
MLCSQNDSCSYCHNRVEMLYHTDKYKSKFCSYLNEPENIENCGYGEYCSFAHNEEEIRVKLIHKNKYDLAFFLNDFKTLACPFSHDHEKATCVYSHNLQDFRRSPLQYAYIAKPCLHWDCKKMILKYIEGCLKEYRQIFYQAVIIAMVGRN